MGDLNLTTDDLGFQLIRGLLQLNDCFLQRINKVKETKNYFHRINLNFFKDAFDPTVGNNGLTCDLLDNPYVIPHPHQGEGERIDYILYRARNGLQSNFS